MGNLSTRAQGVKCMEEGMQAVRNYQDFDRAIALHQKARQLYLKSDCVKAALCLDRLCEFHYRLGEYQQAHSCAQQALAMKQRLLDQQRQSSSSSSEVLEKESTSPHKEESQLTTVSTYDASRLPASSVARTLSNLGCILSQCGKPHQARYFLEAALVLRQGECARLGLETEESMEVATTCTNLAIVWQQLGHVKRAVALHTRAQHIKQHWAPASASMARTYLNLAILHTQGEYLAKARDILQTAERQRLELEEFCHSWSSSYGSTMHSHTTTTSTASSASSCGGVVLTTTDAVSQEEAVTTTTTKHSSPYPSHWTTSFPYSGDTLSDYTLLQVLLDGTIGTVLAQQGNHRKAVVYYQKAITRELAVAPESRVVAEWCERLAESYQHLGHVDKARLVQAKATAIAQVKPARPHLTLPQPTQQPTRPHHPQPQQHAHGWSPWNRRMDKKMSTKPLDNKAP